MKREYEVAWHSKLKKKTKTGKTMGSGEQDVYMRNKAHFSLKAREV